MYVIIISQRIPVVQYEDVLRCLDQWDKKHRGCVDEVIQRYGEH